MTRLRLFAGMPAPISTTRAAVLSARALTSGRRRCAIPLLPSIRRRRRLCQRLGQRRNGDGATVASLMDEVAADERQLVRREVELRRRDLFPQGLRIAEVELPG